MIHKSRFSLIWLLSPLLIGLLSACAPANTSPIEGAGELQGNITVSGAFALYPMMTRWAEEFHKLHPQVTFDISAGGAGKGMADALAGAVDIGMVSREITPEEEARGAYWVPVVKDAVFPVVNADNPVLSDLMQKGVTRAQFIGVYITGEIKTWGQLVGRPEISDPIHIYTRSDAAGAPEVWAKYLGKKQENLLGVGVSGDPGLLDAVIKDKLAIGYNNLGYVFDHTTGLPVSGAMVLPIDQNEDGQAGDDERMETRAKAVEMVASGKYPSPPARLENLVTKGKPSGTVLAFITWVLTDGQQYAAEAGYVPLSPEQLEAALDKVR